MSIEYMYIEIFLYVFKIKLTDFVLSENPEF